MREIIEIAVCDDCAMLAANGEILDDHDGPEPLGLIEPGWIVSVDCGPEGDGCHFSWSSCDGCGSKLGGTRHEASMVQMLPDGNPCGHRGCFPDMCMA